MPKRSTFAYQIPLAQIEAIYEDLFRRYTARGLGLRALHRNRCSTELSLGRIDEARRAYEAWVAAPPETTNPVCEVCERAGRIRFLAEDRQDEAAMDLAAPVLDGTLKCDTHPRNLLGRVLAPLVRLGRREEARAAHVRGVGLLGAHPGSLLVAEHLRFAAVAGSWETGLRLVESGIGDAMSKKNPIGTLLFFGAAALLFDGLGAERSAVELRLPREIPIRRDDDTYAVADLEAWSRARADDLAARFDRRNRNGYYRDLLDEGPRLRALFAKG